MHLIRLGNNEELMEADAMKCMTIFLLVGFLCNTQTDEKKYSFSRDDVGKTPTGWKNYLTGMGESPVWHVVLDETVPSKTGVALMQQSKNPNGSINICLVEDSNYGDVTLETSLRIVSGFQDRGGGIVWRYKDDQNYYFAKVSALERTCRIYRFKKRMDLPVPERVTLATKSGLMLKPGKWITLRIKTTGKSIECSLDGDKIIECNDDNPIDTGKIGLATKADARCNFDALLATPAHRN